MIYLDHAATTPLDPEALDAMLPYLSDRYGNASSVHAWGRAARAAVDEARDAVAALIHGHHSEITFTSGGTEADNLAILGTLAAAPPERRNLIVSTIEHHAVLHAAYAAERLCHPVTRLGVDKVGHVSVDALRDALTQDTALVSILHGNNEIGTVQDVARLAGETHRAGALFHTDAVQTLGLLPIDVKGMGCDLMSLSAHKIYGPKGIGALYVRSGVRVAPLLFGGTQERERRPGTENVAGIVGFGVAARLVAKRREADAVRIEALRDRLIERLVAAVPEVRLNGPRTDRLANNVNMSFESVDGAALLLNLDRVGIAASSGSACSSGAIEPSHVLKAIGLRDDLASCGIRFTLGRTTTADEIDKTVAVLAEIVARLRIARVR